MDLVKRYKFSYVKESTDAGTMPNLKWSFGDSYMRIEEGGWARQATIRELPVAKEIAGVNMRLDAGAIRELHWHKEAEWSFVLSGTVRVTSVDQHRRTFVDDVGPGELWYFPPGIPHSIQALSANGSEFLLIFDDGNFDENKTFLLTDILAHMPKEVIAKNFGVDESALADIPKHELYIFRSKIPGPLITDQIPGAGPVPNWFSHKMTLQEPIRSKHGTIRITDSNNFPASKTIAAALIEILPGGMRELHWHSNADEWQYYLSGVARMTVFNAVSQAKTFDYQSGDIGYVPRFMPHYVENIGPSTLRFLEIFKSDHFEENSLAQWLALTPHELVRAHLNINESILTNIPHHDEPIVPP
ncbi:MAG: cupin domain-containing protein [Hyperionvirus sp.]|uniref:Cupin domain-containing protein n=1 Tax=Hyperionvirus sp. TaxID=2487770 RepID=A0A3G5A5X3_9VIRU|nr:MAG: cupin domain-containing protein [Hyperionvirus sp.]